MALVSKSFTFSAGATIVASEHNTNFDTLYNLVNGNIDNANVNASAGIDASKLDLATIAQNITFTGDNTFAGTTIADLGTVTTADINGGTLDDVQVDGATSTGVLFVNDSTDVIAQLSDQGDSGQVLTSNGAGVLPSFQTFSNSEVFTSDGNFTVPTDVNYVYLYMLGGGGGGGGGSQGSPDTGGGGGGAGGAVDGLIYPVTPSASIAVVVGPGGTGSAGAPTSTSAGGNGTASTFDGIISASGGSGGTHGESNGTAGSGAAEVDVAAASGSTGKSIQTVNFAGGDGAAGAVDGSNGGNGGGGGAPRFIGAGANGGNTISGGGVGQAGSSAAANSGGGGGGGESGGGANAGGAGGNGGSGIVIVVW
jgi:hypothetical protein